MASPAAAAALVHSSEDAIIGLTLDGVITSWNPAAERLYGFTAAEMVGYRMHRVMPSELRDAESRRIGRVVDGSVQRVVNTERLHRDGSRLVVSSSMFPVRDDRYRITAVGLIERDITEQRALEAELLQAKRMEIVGRLARGAAQEFNNINTAILGLAEFLSRRLNGDKSAADDLAAIVAQAVRGSHLASHLLAFDTARGGSVGPVSVNTVLRSMETLLQRLVSERIWLTLDLAPTDAFTTADESRLELILFELVMRIGDTLPTHGSITIATRTVRVDDTAFPTPAGVPSGEYVEVSLRSTGDTTRSAGKDGSDSSNEIQTHATRTVGASRRGDWDFGELGMAMVVSALGQFGGHIATTTLSPDPDVMSELALYLPLVHDVSRTGEELTSSDSTGDEIILLVEDEAAVRGVMARALRDRGYEVLEAQNGEDALNVASAHKLPIDIVVSDVVMPQMDGRALYDQLRSWYPGIRFLFVSGYTRGALATAELRSSVTDFLAKPFRVDALADAVRELLDRRPVRHQDS